MAPASSTATSAKRLIVDPLLSTLDEVKALLTTQPAGTGHVFQRRLYIHTGKDGRCDEVDFSGKPTAFFTDTTSLNLLGDVLTDRMQHHRGNLDAIVDYTVLSLTDTTVEVPLVPGQILCFALSLKDRPTYYDLAVGDHAASTLCYGAVTNTNIPGLWHSGDRSAGPSVLLHSLRMEALNLLPENVAGGAPLQVTFYVLSGTSIGSLMRGR